MALSCRPFDLTRRFAPPSPREELSRASVPLPLGKVAQRDGEGSIGPAARTPSIFSRIRYGEFWGGCQGLAVGLRKRIRYTISQNQLQLLPSGERIEAAGTFVDISLLITFIPSGPLISQPSSYPQTASDSLPSSGCTSKPRRSFANVIDVQESFCRGKSNAVEARQLSLTIYGLPSFNRYALSSAPGPRPLSE